MSKPTIIIVPGAWHRAEHYQRLTDKLEQINYEAVGLTLPSLNSKPPHASWDQDAEAVRKVVLKSLESSKDVVMVSHSFGGIAMSEAVKGLGKKERNEQGLNGGVVRLVYMCAMALPEGQSHMGQLQPQTAEEEEKQRSQQNGIRFEEDGAMALNKDLARDILYNRCDPKDAEAALSLIGTHPSGPLTIPATYTAYRAIPSTYIVCENDHALPVAAQERMIVQGDGAFDVERCKEGHSPFLSNPGFIVDCIRRAAGEKVNSEGTESFY